MTVYNNLELGIGQIMTGVYCPCLISHGGIPRGDSQFTLNGAYKFIMPCPKEEVIEDIIQGLLDRKSDAVERRKWTKEQFRNQDLWNYSIQVGRDESVEEPKGDDHQRPDSPYRETHTFRNLMENPLCVILYNSNYAAKSFEVRTICHYVTWGDESADSYEQKIAHFINTLGNVAHGSSANFPGMIFYTVEEFDNSMQEGKEGIRVAKIKEGVKNLYAKMPWKQRVIG